MTFKTMIKTTGVVFVTGILFGTVYSSTCLPIEMSKDYLDKVLIGHSVSEIYDIDHHGCARYCMSHAICKSIDYDRTENRCKLNDVDQSSVDSSEFKIKIGSIFSNINEWPSAMVKSCGLRPCQANQRCYMNGPSHICRDITCDISGQEIQNGKLRVNVLGANKFLNKADVKCNVGYFQSQGQVECQASGQWQLATCKSLRDCKEILDEFPKAESGLYDIKLWNSGKLLKVNCDMKTEGGGWTIFHRRMDGSVEFYRNFTEYENGFGNADGELWLGLKSIQELAEQGATELRLDMTKPNDETGQETFQDFKLTDGIKYKLTIGTRSASAEFTGLKYHNGKPFSTFDRDLDSDPNRNCAVSRHGAWWYHVCSYVNINGLYVTPGTSCTFPGAATGPCGHVHYGFNLNKALKSSSMMLRRK